MSSRSTATTYCTGTTIFSIKYFREPVWFGLQGQLGSEASACRLLFSIQTLKYSRKIMVPVNTTHLPKSSAIACLSGFRTDASTPLDAKADDTLPAPTKKILALKLCFPSPACHYEVKFKIIIISCLISSSNS